MSLHFSYFLFNFTKCFRIGTSDACLKSGLHTLSPGSPRSPGSPLIIPGVGGNSAATQTKPHPSEQHFSPSPHSLSSKHSPGILPSGPTSFSSQTSKNGAGQRPGFSSGSTGNFKIRKFFKKVLLY